MALVKKILIANRGEIALRILRACQELGIKTVAVHSTCDSDLMHVRLADESICIGPDPSKQSYMNVPALLTAADITGADAIHPGFGFLAENADFASVVQQHGITFIGPDAEHIEMMGDKINAKKTMEALGVPTIPGSSKKISTDEEILEEARKVGFPLIIKATAGGGGKGMKLARSKEELIEAYRMAQSEARANFDNDRVYMERYLQNPRHIEIQVLADHYGNAVHLGERDCSLQRRHQKVFEEAPSPGVSPEQRDKLGELVAEATSKMGYKGVGTFEFLYENGEFFFMEMNTRIQVEHPVTEMVTGIDLIKEQIKVASGEKLAFTQDDIVLRGHAIECRVNAEDPENFFPSPGKIVRYHAPGGLGVRVDSHLYTGYTVPQHYDSMVAKLIVYADDREQCLMRLQRALKEYVIDGIKTTIPLHQKLTRNAEIREGDYTIHWLEKNLEHLD